MIKKIFLSLLFLVGISFAEIPKFKSIQNLDNLENAQYFISEKYDGIYGFWDGKVLKTKQGLEIVAPKWWLENFPPFKMQGELWVDYNAFSDVLSIVSKSLKKDSKELKDSNPKEWERVKFYVFEAQSCKNCTLNERLALLEKIKNPNIKIISQIPLQSKKQAEDFYNEVLAKNGEGIIIRKDSLDEGTFKLKPFSDAECKVIGFKEGKGRLKGKMGSLMCEAEINGGLKRFKIGSGFSDAARENPPKIGTIITYKFQGYTKNNLPRFPVFLRIRDGGI